MKYFSVTYTFLMVLFILSSCEKPKEKKPFCTTQFYKAIYITDYDFFKLYEDITRDGMRQTTNYTAGNGSTYSHYSTEMTIGNLCTLANPLIGFEIWMKNKDAFAVKTAYIEELGKTGRTDLELLQFSGTAFYRANTSHTFQDATGKTSGTLLLHLDFGFPYQGNSSADSLYFFSNIKQLKADITFSKTGE